MPNRFHLHEHQKPRQARREDLAAVLRGSDRGILSGEVELVMGSPKRNRPDMRSRIRLGLALAFIALTGCGKKADETTYTIAVIPKGTTHEF
jgi:hypothetical protein